MEFKKHIVRSVRQDQARIDILSQLSNNDVYIVMDFAMKFLPLSGREPQADWFGKRGIPWHITHVTTRDISGTGYRTRLYVHAFGNVAQDAYTVLAILQNVFSQIKKGMPYVNRAFVRSDNAGCYKSAVTILAIPKLSQLYSISVKRWDFSEAQAGKGPCDRAAAIVKRNIWLYAAENHRCTNVEEFVVCANSHNGIRSATIAHCELQVQKQPKPRIAGISQYNNFEFDDNGDITVWRAYKIGVGKRLRRSASWSDDPYMPSLSVITYHTEGLQHRAMIDTTEYWKVMQRPPGAANPQPVTDTPTILGPCGSASEEDDDDDDDGDTEERPLRMSPEGDESLYPCPEPTCSRVYQKRHFLDWHLQFGKHRYQPERISLRDAAIGMYKEHLECPRISAHSLPSVQDVIQTFQASPPESGTSSEALTMGWVLRIRRSAAAFDADVRLFLKNKFEEGEITGRKLDPLVVANKMRDNFPQEKWLCRGQIASFWSRLARTKSQEAIDDLAMDDEDDRNQAHVGSEEDLSDDPYYNSPEFDIHDAFDDNVANIFERD